jgi:hypothetical protein
MSYVPVDEKNSAAIEVYSPQMAPVHVAACAFAAVASLAALSIQPARADTPSPQPAVYVGERWVCRPADASNSANATMTSGTQQAHCRAINVTLTTSDGRVYVIGKPQTDASGGEEQASMTSPAYSGGVTPKEFHDGWVAMVKRGLGVEDTTSNGVVNIGNRWVCRPADADHPISASTSSKGTAVPLSCRAVNLSLQTSSGQMIVIGHVQAKAKPSVSAKDDTNEQTAPLSAPLYAAGLTIQEMNDSWNSCVNRVFNIATSAAGGG